MNWSNMVSPLAQAGPWRDSKKTLQVHSLDRGATRQQRPFDVWNRRPCRALDANENLSVHHLRVVEL
jgi:hypothetical protein